MDYQTGNWVFKRAGWTGHVPQTCFGQTVPFGKGTPFGVRRGLFLVSGGSAIGGGDVKLMASCGLILGWKLIILAFLLGCIIGSVVHVIRIKISGAGRVLAMGPYLSVGIFLAALWGNTWISWYLGLLGM